MGKIERLSDDVTLYQGDCRDILPTLGKFDAVVTDPPYELGFMGKSWDASGVAFCPETWRAVFNVMKPGAHLVAFGAPKNYHRLACAIEDAGFEIRDSLMWVFGSGFPKSYNVGQSVEKLQTTGKARRPDRDLGGLSRDRYSGDNEGKLFSDTGGTVEYTTEDGERWAGWGTALKPAYEPIVLARKPLSEKTVAANVLRWGTGALNIDATRVDYASADDKAASVAGTLSRATNASSGRDNRHDGWQRPWQDGDGLKEYNERCAERIERSSGRWPANLCHDGSQGVLELFPHTKSGTLTPDMNIKETTGWSGGSQSNRVKNTFTTNEGSAARFFYCAKASKQDRAGSKHPTVKPINLMRWLIRMVTPPNGLILDPFAGSGTTAQAAVEEGYAITIIEKEADYFADICSRMNELKKTKYEVSA